MQIILADAFPKSWLVFLIVKQQYMDALTSIVVSARTSGGTRHRYADRKDLRKIFSDWYSYCNDLEVQYILPYGSTVFFALDIFGWSLDINNTDFIHLSEIPVIFANNGIAYAGFHFVQPILPDELSNFKTI